MSHISNPSPQSIAAAGYCPQCRQRHTIHLGSAQSHCQWLMERLRTTNRIDFDVPTAETDSRLTTSSLYGKARGQMFGVLECEQDDGRRLRLKAFSGQYNGIWLVPGWVPPLFDVAAFDALVAEGDPPIKALGRQIADLADGPTRQALILKRKRCSQKLMRKIHQLYTVHNSQGQTSSLNEFFQSGIPAGAGDCCAPKLLNFAARQQLKPVALGEFFWGCENRSATRHQGCFYSACEEKCRPLLGFMLCGIEACHG